MCSTADRAFPLAWHFHYLIAWKGSSGDCRSLAVWAKRMDLECISIGSEVPAVGGRPGLLGTSWKLRKCHLQPGLRPRQYSFITALYLSERPGQTAPRPTQSGSELSPLSWCLQGTTICHTALAPAGPYCSTSSSVIGGPAHLIPPPQGAILVWEGSMFPELRKKWCKSHLES